MLHKVSIYSIGVGRTKSSDGGWGCHVDIFNKTVKFNGWNHGVTIEDMEIIAVVKGMEYCKHTKGFKIFTTSNYVKDGLTKLELWKKSNWFSHFGKIKNLELWKKIDEYSSNFEIEWHFLQNYHDNELMLSADKLAFEGLEKAKLHSKELKIKRETKKKKKILAKKSK